MTTATLCPVATRATGPRHDTTLVDALGHTLTLLAAERRGALLADDEDRLAYVDRVAARVLGQRLDALAAALD